MTHSPDPDPQDPTLTDPGGHWAPTAGGSAPDIILNARSYEAAVSVWRGGGPLPSHDLDALPPGASISGRYIIRGVLGTGGMGVVYHARDQQANRDVALKLASGWVDSDSAGRLQLSQEFRAMAAFRHPNLPAVHDFGHTPDGSPFLVMDYVSGDTCAAAAPLPLHTFYPVFVQFLRALAFIHERGYLHRDIKPQNAILHYPAAATDPSPTPGAAPRLVLLDFGLMERIGAASDRRITGTPRFMAPEIIAGQPLDPRTDLYALGITGYILLTGEPPFQAASPSAVFDLHQHAERPHLSELAPDLPRELSDLLRRLIAADPRQRPDSADAVLREMATLTDAVLQADLSQRRAFLYVGSLVGRDAEIAALNEAVGSARGGQAALALIEGDAGTGKSRLLEHAQIQAMTGGFAVTGCAIRPQDRSPYQALRTVLHGLVPMARRLAIRSPDNAGWRRVEPPADILSPAVPDPAADAGMDERQRLIAALLQWLGRLAERQPLAIFIDDLQWCDDASMQVFRAVAAELPPATLLVAAYRPDAVAGAADPRAWERLPGARRLRIQPLAGDAFTGLIDQLLGRHRLPTAFITTVETLTGGSPYYVIELLRSLIDREALLREHGVWRLQRERFQLPASLQDLLEQRLASLSPVALRVMELLCVGGGRLDATTVADLVAADEAAFCAALDELLTLQLLRRAGPTLSLVHDHLLAAVGEAMPADRARHLHQALGEWLDARLPAEHPDRLALLGQHYAAGDAPLKGLDLLERAGRRAYQREQHGAARDLLLAAVSLLEAHPDAPKREARLYDLKKILGVVCLSTDPARCAECGEYVYQHAMQRGVLRRLPRLRRLLPDPLGYLAILGIYLPLRVLRERRRALVEFRRDLTDAFLATGYQVNSLAALGQLSSARKRAERLRGLSLTDRGIAEAFIVISSVMSRQHQDGPGACKPFERLRLVLHSPLARFVPLYTRQMMIGITHYTLAHDSALQLHPDFARDLTVADLYAKRADHAFLMHLNLHAAIEHACQRGDLREAHRLEEDFRHVLQRLGGQALQREWLVDLAIGRVEIACGEMESASRRMERLLGSGDSYFTRGFGLLLQGLLQHAWGRQDAALTAAREALQIARDPEVKAVLFEYRVLQLMGHIHLAAEREAQAAAALEGMSRYVALPGHRTRYFAVESALLRLRLLARSQPRIAMNVARQALQVAEEMASPRQAAEAATLLAETMVLNGLSGSEAEHYRKVAADYHLQLGNLYLARQAER